VRPSLAPECHSGDGGRRVRGRGHAAGGGAGASPVLIQDPLVGARLRDRRAAQRPFPVRRYTAVVRILRGQRRLLVIGVLCGVFAAGVATICRQHLPVGVVHPQPHLGPRVFRALLLDFFLGLHQHLGLGDQALDVFEAPFQAGRRSWGSVVGRERLWVSDGGSAGRDPGGGGPALVGPFVFGLLGRHVPVAILRLEVHVDIVCVGAAAVHVVRVRVEMLEVKGSAVGRIAIRSVNKSATDRSLATKQITPCSPCKLTLS